ncbi:MAG: aminotransferase class III-fold pyridoxal phosphate-dependent enzyme, partial [Cyanobacteria bacterium]|nr:aminotransferase class III-fold pyridoxal phosphate-dependent enzyme [Cyanobacteriota bacterium]
PHVYRCPFNSASTPCEAQECIDACLDYIENTLFKMSVMPEEVAAFILEPIQGEGGYIVPPSGFLTQLKALADRYGILVIIDEVQSGVGRTGKMWACEHTPNFEPDILLSAKGLASGLPLGAIIAKADLMTWGPGAHATTFGGNPVNCAAALKTLELIENGLMQNAALQGARFKKGLETLMDTCDIVGDVRGEGLMLGIEFVQSKACKTPLVDVRNKIVQDCFQKGLLLLGCGENSIRFSPPLVIQAHQVDYVLEVFSEIVRKYQ